MQITMVVSCAKTGLRTSNPPCRRAWDFEVAGIKPRGSSDERMCVWRIIGHSGERLYDHPAPQLAQG